MVIMCPQWLEIIFVPEWYQCPQVLLTWHHGSSFHWLAVPIATCSCFTVHSPHQGTGHEAQDPSHRGRHGGHLCSPGEHLVHSLSLWNIHHPPCPKRQQSSLSQWQWHLGNCFFWCHSHVYCQLCGHRFQPVDAQEILPLQHPVPQWGHFRGGNLLAHLQGMREHKGPGWDSSALIQQHPITMAGVCHHHSHSHDDDED